MLFEFKLMEMETVGSEGKVGGGGMGVRDIVYINFGGCVQMYYVYAFMQFAF